MKRDVGYAVVAALSLSALAALFALVMAPGLADPDASDRYRGPVGSVPVLPLAPDNGKAIEQAVAVLETRDLFRAAAPADMATLNRLSAARIAPPVELVPVEGEPPGRRYAAAPPPLPQQPFYRPPPPPAVAAPQPPPGTILETRPLPPPPPTPASPPPVAPSPDAWSTPTLPSPPTTQQIVTVRDGRFPLTLRGVFPDARTGGRAHVALPNGQIVSTGPGGVIQGFQVLRINPASIVVQGRGGPQLRLEMPGY